MAMHNWHTYKADIAGPTCLYRAYIGKALAYVGVTRNTLGRFARHKSQKPWWCEVDRVDIEWFDTRAEAFAAEKSAIRDESPIYNVARPKAGC